MTTWTTREVPAGQVVAGDVIHGRDGLWAVTSATASHDDDGKPDGDVVLTVTRAETDRAFTFPADRPVAVLLADDDARALALVEAELGGKVVGRDAA